MSENYKHERCEFLIIVMMIITILKYKYLTTEIHRIWNVKTNVTPVIMGGGDWNDLKTIQKIPEQHSGKARQGHGLFQAYKC
jgi:hypothetical protein